MWIVSSLNNLYLIVFSTNTNKVNCWKNKTKNRLSNNCCYTLIEFITQLRLNLAISTFQSDIFSAQEPKQEDPETQSQPSNRNFIVLSFSETKQNANVQYFKIKPHIPLTKSQQKWWIQRAGESDRITCLRNEAPKRSWKRKPWKLKIRKGGRDWSREKLCPLPHCRIYNVSLLDKFLQYSPFYFFFKKGICRGRSGSFNIFAFDVIFFPRKIIRTQNNTNLMFIFSLIY